MKQIHWGYCANDRFFKPAPMLVKSWSVRIEEVGGNLLFDVGPDA